MRLLLFAVALLLVHAAEPAAQSSQSDEQQIRALITAEETGKTPPRTQDRIFWSGALKRPMVGNEAAQEIPDEDQPANRVSGSQRNKINVRRIEIAKSGDLAYEFHDSVLSYDLKSGKKISFPRSALRVWRKEAGQWKVAAHFSHPHYQEPAAPTK